MTARRIVSKRPDRDSLATLSASTDSQAARTDSGSSRQRFRRVQRMREGRTISQGQWQLMVRQREEIAGWLCRLRIELDTNSQASLLQKRFDDLTREYHEIELLMAN